MLKTHVIWLSLVCSLYCLSNHHLVNEKAQDEYKTVAIILASRHGARLPHNDTIQPTWCAGRPLSQMTLEGKLQQYMLGQLIRHEYRDLFGDQELSIDEYEIRSSRKQRTIVSGYENFKGLSNYDHGLPVVSASYLRRVMPPFIGEYVDQTINDVLSSTISSKFTKFRSPILVSIPDLDDKNPQDKDIFMSVTEDNWARETLEKALQIGSRTMARYAKELRRKLGVKGDIDFTTMKVVGDILISDAFHCTNNCLIQGDDPLAQYLKNANTVGHLLKFIDEKVVKNAFDHFARELEAVLTGKISQEDKKSLKFVHFSMHDTDLSPLLIHLGIIDIKCNLRQLASKRSIGCQLKPGYSSSIIFELAQSTTGEYVTFFRFNGQYMDICSGQTPPPIRKFPCSLPQLMHRLNSASKQKQNQ